MHRRPRETYPVAISADLGKGHTPWGWGLTRARRATLPRVIEPKSSARDRLGRRLPWICAGLLAAWCYVILVVAARVDVLGRFDDGIEYTTVTYLLHGQLPYSDFYEPYGIGLGIPGAIPGLVGIRSVMALRLVYGLFRRW